MLIRDLLKGVILGSKEEKNSFLERVGLEFDKSVGVSV